MLKLKICFLRYRISFINKHVVMLIQKWSQILPLFCWYQGKRCYVSVMDENHQEWMITLYDLDSNGKITREVNFSIDRGPTISLKCSFSHWWVLSLCLLQNMLSLMQTICEVVEASVKQLVLSNGSTLRVKLSVTPLTSRKGNRKGEDWTYLKTNKTNGLISYLINLLK